MAIMYWIQWSRSAGLWSGPFLSMMRSAASCVSLSSVLIAPRPGFARAGVGSVAVGPQALAVEPGVGDRVDDSLAGKAEHLRHDRGGGHLHQHHVIEPDAVEAVLEGDHALDLMGLDHRGE